MIEKLNIIFEDNHLIVLIKPHNLLSQGDETGDENLVDLLKNYLKEKYNKPGNVFVGCVHRLDRPTGGVMVFAKTSKAAERLSSQIQEGEMEKNYLAVLNGSLKMKADTLINYLEKDEDTNTTKVLSFAKQGSKKAELSYKVLEEKDSLSLVDVSLSTGRSHQIRVQFAHIGSPVFGDIRYKDPSINKTKTIIDKNLPTGRILVPYSEEDKAKGHNMALWAYKLRFLHPVTKEPLVFVVYPENTEQPWCNFSGSKTWNRIAGFN